MPMFTPHPLLVLVPTTQPLPSTRVHASTDTRSRGSSAGVFCNEVVGVPRHWISQTGRKTTTFSRPLQQTRT